MTEEFVDQSGLDEHEKEFQTEYLRRYKYGKYQALLKNYCHEGFQVCPSDSDAPAGYPWSGVICSHHVYGKTPDECTQLMADYVAGQIRNGYLGC